MSVQSEAQNYAETCARSHEFLRRGCSLTPTGCSWAGDLLITSGTFLKQSEVRDMRGGADNVEYSFPQANESCEDVTATLPSGYRVEETDIRTGEAETFAYHTPKASDPAEEQNWNLGMYQSTNDCGKLRDGGDALQSEAMYKEVVSLCGTVRRSSGMFEPKAHYLDNRKSYPSDPDNGLLVCIRTGAAWSWELRYAPVDRSLEGGLVMSDDVTAAFTAALTKLGMDHNDVFEFGMI